MFNVDEEEVVSFIHLYNNKLKMLGMLLKGILILKCGPTEWFPVVLCHSPT